MAIEIKKRSTEEKVNNLISEFALLKVLLETMIARIENLDERIEKIEANQTKQS
jgi:hypothetical protein